MKHFIPIVVLGLALAACKTDASSVVNAAASGDSSAVKTAAVDSAKSEATTQVQGQLEKMTPSANYPAKKCVVTDEDLGPGAVAYSYNGREVQFCCPGCAQTFMKNPAMYLAKLDAAR